MKIDVISFTRAGARLSAQLKESLDRCGTEPEDGLELFTKFSGAPDTEEKIICPAESLRDWTGAHFTEGKGLLFIGACGIAVRSIAPFIRSKVSDPAVLVMDEKGEYVIPILSGHLGEANRIAKKIAAFTGGHAVMTTATDVNDLFAVDVFASRNGLDISDMKKAKEVSAALLEGETIPLYYDGTSMDVVGEVPRLLEVYPLSETSLSLNSALFAPAFPAADAIPSTPAFPAADAPPSTPVFPAADAFSSVHTSSAAHPVFITCRQRSGGALCLIPRQLYLGIGCRKGKSVEELQQFVEQTLAGHELDRKALAGVYSLDLKKEEAGICELARKFGLPFRTFSPQELRAMEGEFHSSDFVKAQTGVDNVCERAVMAAGADRILVPKISRSGMTLSIGIRKGKICFE